MIQRPTRAAALRTSFLVAFMVIHAFNCCREDPDRTTAAAFPRYTAGEVLADSASLQWPGPLCAAISVSTRRGSIPRACHSGAVDLLRPRRLGGVPGARAWRDLGDATDRAWRYLCHPLEDALRGDATVRRSAKSWKSSKSTLRSITGLRLWNQCFQVRVTKWTLSTFLDAMKRSLASALRAPRCFPSGTPGKSNASLISRSLSLHFSRRNTRTRLREARLPWWTADSAAPQG